MSRTSFALASVVVVTAGLAAAPAALAGSPQPTRAVPAGAVAQVAPAARTPLTTVGRARLALPRGWVAARRADGLNHWCLRPAGTKACAIQYAEGTRTLQVDTETQGGFVSDPQYCDSGSDHARLTRYATVPWGGRSADYRRWDVSCGRKAGPTVVQYVTPTWPASVLAAETTRADGDAVDRRLAQIVRGSVLPRQSRPQRLVDVGIVRSATPVRGGTRIALDRVVLDGRGKAINTVRRSCTYVVPSAAARPGTFRVGRLASVHGDGLRITFAS